MSSHSNDSEFSNDNLTDTKELDVKKPSSRVTQNDVEAAESALNDRLEGIVSGCDEFRAVYWPMEKWIDDNTTAELLSVMISVYPNLNWSNPVSVQFNSMLSVVNNVDWITNIRTKYDFTLVDFMRVVFMNWPELFTRKKYAATLSSAIVSSFVNELK